MRETMRKNVAPALCLEDLEALEKALDNVDIRNAPVDELLELLPFQATGKLWWHPRHGARIWTELQQLRNAVDEQV